MISRIEHHSREKRKNYIENCINFFFQNDAVEKRVSCKNKNENPFVLKLFHSIIIFTHFDFIQNKRDNRYEIFSRKLKNTTDQVQVHVMNKLGEFERWIDSCAFVNVYSLLESQ